MKKITLTQGYFALVDNEDFEWLSKYKWAVSKHSCTCYAVTNLKIGHNKYVRTGMHRLILDLKKDDEKKCDHIDRNGLNNQKNNLRICNTQQNNQNRKPNNNSYSKYKGVNWDQRRKMWSARIEINKQRVYLGCYDSELEAARIYDKIALFEFGEFAYTNFPRKNYAKTKLLSAKKILKNRQEKKTSKFKGVSRSKGRKKWRATIYVGGKNIHIGCFDNEKDASNSYKRFCAELREVC